MNLLKADNLTHYFGGLCAISKFNLELREGELVGLIGPNGAGKTTVFNLITGVYQPSQGTVFLGDRKLSKMPPSRITAGGIARTFQNIRLFKNLSVLDNVRIASGVHSSYSTLESLFRTGRFRKQEQELTDHAFQLLADFQLHDYAFARADSLSYGLQRRLEIVRALATQPKIMLLDEPAAGMNPSEIGDLMATIRRIRKDYGLTILLIEHQMKLVMGLCERILVLDFGETIAEGTPEEIRNNPEVLEAYLGEK